MHRQERGSVVVDEVDVDDKFARRSLWGLHPWSQHVRSSARPVARQLLEGIVGGHPPYHAETFVLTDYERAALAMEGGTAFHFVR
jgi:hypothetical protein